VPDVVEREADQRERAGGDEQDPADRLVSEDQRQESGCEDPVEPEQDEVMGGIGERAGIAALVDVQRHVPHQARVDGRERDRGEAERQRGPRGDAHEAAEGVRERGDPGRPPGAVREREQQQERVRHAHEADHDGDLAELRTSRWSGGEHPGYGSVHTAP
jgi:hypothetical protein